MRSVLPSTRWPPPWVCTAGSATRTPSGPPGEKITSVQQVEQVVRIAKELGREVATARRRTTSTDRRDLQQRRRDHRPPGLRAEPPAGPARPPSTPDASGDARSTTCGARGDPAPHVCRGQRGPRSCNITFWRNVTTTTARAAEAAAVRPGGDTRSRVFPFAVFVLTFGLLLSDYMSRQVLSAVFPFLKLEWALTDTQLARDEHRRADRGRSRSRCRCSATAGAAPRPSSLMGALGASPPSAAPSRPTTSR